LRARLRPASGLSILALLGLLSGVPAPGHDRETTAVTWNQAVAYVIHERCGACHRDDGSAFSLMTYDDARPWAVAIRDEVLARTMPPWGAVKGFGRFRNDNALSPSQTNLIVSWVEGGVPQGTGDEPSFTEFPSRRRPDIPESAVRITGPTTLGQALLVDGLWPEGFQRDSFAQITATLPDGRVEPLLWLYDYDPTPGHAFLLKTPIQLPAGTVIRGVEASASLLLLPPPPVTLENYTGPRLVANRPPVGH
jgi:mono/diheme cytochrome c family protein